MIDESHQGKDYGRAAMIEAIKRMRAKPDCQEIALSIEPENAVAASSTKVSASGKRVKSLRAKQ